MNQTYAFYKNLAAMEQDGGHVLIATYGFGDRPHNGWNRGHSSVWGYRGAWYSTSLGRLLAGLR